jgi:TRAP-type uncharacterized transport system substrate-binding protein
MMDGKVDAAIATTYWAGGFKDTSPTPGYLQLESSGKNFYQISWTADVVQASEETLGGSVAAQEVEAGVLPGQDQPFWVAGYPVVWASHKDLPDRVAKEFINLFIDNLDQIGERHDILDLLDTELMVTGWKKELGHPGALEAYRERGIIK